MAVEYIYIYEVFVLFGRGKRLAGWSNSSGRSTRNRQMLGWIRVAARATVQPAAADQPSREIGEDIVGGWQGGVSSILPEQVSGPWGAEECVQDSWKGNS